MRVLVTGSDGLLGSALKTVLGDEHVYHNRKNCDLLNFYETKNFCS